MAITSVYIWYPSGVAGVGSAYDLRTVATWSEPDPNPTSIVNTRFWVSVDDYDQNTGPVEFDKADFETAMDAIFP